MGLDHLGGGSRHSQRECLNLFASTRFREMKRKAASREGQGKLSERTLGSILGKDKEDEAFQSPAGIVGMGSVNLDLLATVDAYPEPDAKIRSSDFKNEGGGNCGNCLTAVSRLMSSASTSDRSSSMLCDVRIVSKVGDDATGDEMIRDLASEGMDCR